MEVYESGYEILGFFYFFLLYRIVNTKLGDQWHSVKFLSTKLFFTQWKDCFLKYIFKLKILRVILVI